MMRFSDVVEKFAKNEKVRARRHLWDKWGRKKMYIQLDGKLVEVDPQRPLENRVVGFIPSGSDMQADDWYMLPDSPYEPDKDATLAEYAYYRYWKNRAVDLCPWPQLRPDERQTWEDLVERLVSMLVGETTLSLLDEKTGMRLQLQWPKGGVK